VSIQAVADKSGELTIVFQQAELLCCQATMPDGSVGVGGRPGTALLGVIVLCRQLIYRTL
jgi:hypothetical protein